MKFKIEKNWLGKISSVLDYKINHNEIYCVTDSREITQKDFFFALKGESFDGHQFISSVLERSLGVIFSDSHNIEDLPEEYIKVTDTNEFLKQLAIFKIQLFKETQTSKIIALTGSNGKTTTKEMLASFLQHLGYSIYKTKGNFNNLFGLPFSILDADIGLDFYIFEIGTNSWGEIQKLVEICKPEYGFITNIGRAHLECFKNLDGVLKEKRALYDYLVSFKDGRKRFFLNANDDKLAQLPKTSEVITIGPEDADHSYLATSHSLKFSVQSEEIINKNILGLHNYHNLAMVYIVCRYLTDHNDEKLVAAARSIKLNLDNRSMWKNWKNKDLFLDAYNANPDSFLASIASFSEVVKDSPQKKPLMIIGDMYELGESAPREHRKLGEIMKEIPREPKIIYVGEYSDDFKKGLEKDCLSFRQTQDLKDKFSEIIVDVDLIYAKASRGVGLEVLFD